MSTCTKLSGAWLLKDMQALSPISVRHLSYEARCGYVLNPIENQALARALDDVSGAKLGGAKAHSYQRGSRGFFGACQVW
jgi:hypothetical protein